MKKFLLLIIIFLLSSTPAFASFGYSKSITVDKTKVGGTVATPTSFPVEFDNTDTNLATTGNGGHVQNTNGYDIYFYSTSDCKTTRLPAERELYTATTGRYTGWVQVASLSTTTNTTIYVCYGDSSVSTDPNLDGTYGATKVWDSNYIGIFHLGNGTTLSVADSTGINSAVNHTAVASSTGMIDGAAYGTDSTKYIDLIASSSMSTHTGTMSIWFNPVSSPSGEGILLGNTYSDSKYGQSLYYASNGYIYLVYARSADCTSLSHSSGTYITGIWHNLDLVWDGSNVRLYIDGSQNGSASQTCDALPGYTTKLFLPGFGTTYYFKGTLDEARLSNSARSADWITTEYNNQNATSTFYTIGAETPLVTASVLPRLIINYIRLIINNLRLIIN
jgi:hypothetical protein